ncbi:MAG: 16S rRNA (uracil(1498)-N(3))-methyltransferase [Flavobacteriales bacterium]
MQLFYNPTIETDLFLEKEEHVHASKVLRKKNGDSIFVMNGKGDLFQCKIEEISSKKTLISITDKKIFQKTNNLHIAIAPTKNNNRIEFFLEKATEIGISKITPILCDRSERKVIKNERMAKIILSAAKQSNSFYVPILNEMISLSQFLKENKSAHNFIAHCEDEDTKTDLFSRNLEKNSIITILIGPEGDFTSKEIELAKTKNFKELSLGESRLRTETAGIVAATHYNLL